MNDTEQATVATHEPAKVPAVVAHFERNVRRGASGRALGKPPARQWAVYAFLHSVCPAAVHVSVIQAELQASRPSVAAALCMLFASGHIDRVGRGMYRIPAPNVLLNGRPR